MSAIDPVCRMEVQEANAKWTTEHEGNTYYFCMKACKETFDMEPHRYLTKADWPAENRLEKNNE